jgi:alpha-N-arabinofuranosidase
MGRGVYGGLFEPDGEFSDEHGFRRDVLELVGELGVTIVRYPGGNFLSGYDWRDGIGPQLRRPRRLDLAWHALETNQFGTDEFMRWCSTARTEPMLAVNLGTGNLRDALQLMEYCNGDGASTLAGERAENGSAEPYDVRLWCLGRALAART